MDEYTLKLRSEDSICRLALNTPARVAQRSLSASQVEKLRQEKDLAKGWHQALQNDRAIQHSNMCFLKRAIKQSRDFGGPSYKNVDNREQGIYSTVNSALSRSASEMIATQLEIKKAATSLDASQSQEGENEGQVRSLSQWFARYGEPKRQPSEQEKLRTFVKKPRRRPFDGTSSARMLRLGKVVWQDLPPHRGL